MTIVFAVSSFLFLIQEAGKIDGAQFADKIRRAYSVENPMTAEAVSLIEESLDWIECVNLPRREFRLRLNDDYYNKVVNGR